MALPIIPLLLLAGIAGFALTRKKKPSLIEGKPFEGLAQQLSERGVSPDEQNMIEVDPGTGLFRYREDVIPLVAMMLAANDATEMGGFEEVLGGGNSFKLTQRSDLGPAAIDPNRPNNAWLVGGFVHSAVNTAPGARDIWVTPPLFAEVPTVDRFMLAMLPGNRPPATLPFVVLVRRAEQPWPMAQPPTPPFVPGA